MITKTLTILFADVQGYTSRTGRQTREQNARFIIELQTFIREQAAKRNGTFVKSMGDGFLLSFESPTDAVSCGRSIQHEISLKNSCLPDQDNLIRFRIGISTGEVMVDDKNDVFGEAVNIAARIEKFASPNEVFISESTYLAMNKSEFQALDMGPQKFKNVVQEVRVYRIYDEKTDTLANLQQPIKKQHLLFGAGAISLSALTILIIFLTQKGSAPKDQLSELRALLEARNYLAVVSASEKLLPKTPDNPALYALAGEAFFKLHDAEHARHYLLRAAELDTKNSGVCRMISELYADSKDYDNAILWLGRYINAEQNPIERKIALERMNELEQLQSRAAKRDSFTAPRNVLTITPEMTVAESSPAVPAQDSVVIQAQLSNSGEEPLTPENIRENPLLSQAQNPPAQQANPQKMDRQAMEELRDRVKQYLDSGNQSAALQILETAQQEQPNNPQVYMFSGRTYLKMDNIEKAEEALKKAIALNPQNPGPYFELSILYEKTQNFSSSISMLERFISLERDETRRSRAEQRLQSLKDQL